MDPRYGRGSRGGRLDGALINLSLVESRPLATRAVRGAEQAFAASRSTFAWLLRDC